MEAIGTATATATHAARALSSGATSSLASASLGKIVATGLLLGLVHVLTGPDHLSALAAMTTNSSWKAFSLGLRWGCGHSIGLIIMALIFFAAGQTVDLDKVGVYCNYVVGVFMIALGAWTAHHVRRKYTTQRKEALLASAAPPFAGERLLPARAGRSSSHSAASEQIPFAVTPLTPAQPAARQSSASDRGEGEAVGAPAHAAAASSSSSSPSPTSAYHVLLSVDAGREERPSASPVSLSSRMPSLRLEEPADKREEAPTRPQWCCKCCPTASFSNPTTQRITALLVGIVHGIAGPGGILGVLPAVVLDDWLKSVAYLGSFCVSSILIMGVFAALYGEVTGRLGRNSLLMEFRIGLCSASFSVIVGVAWIVLQATGLMDEVFE